MSKIILYTGGCCEPKSAIAVNRFDDVSKAQYLTTGDLGVTAFKEIMFLESSNDIDWRVRRNFDLDLDDIDTDLVGYFILDSVSDFTYRLIYRENAYGDAEYFKKRVSVNIDDLISKIRAADAQLIILSDDVGCSVRPTNKNERLTQEVIGDLNRYIAGKADEVYIVECGIARRIK
ncbi:MAG: bifunctional adenosylcobinamide kinase/adenosylcobinamide-phosphate guanylyltransferase [Oribacterium sp.]|nr:bifunctional adenosylcobinamide kinase/adenosylcobinamide-phosphate guanylyltransferase [Oribacterium sp.]